MKIKELLIERIDVSWITPWISRSVNAASFADDDVEWYSAFFKNLNQDSELQQWKEQIKLPLKIVSRIIDNPSNTKSMIGASHYITDDDEHEIEVTVNASRAPDDDAARKKFIDQLTSIMVHELNHAHQREQQISSTGSVDLAYEIKTDLFKKQPPAPANEKEKYYLYLLDHMEQDAWLAQIATEIHQALGDDSLTNLNEIFQKVIKDQYLTISGKILDLKSLRALYLALDHYNGYLKQRVDRHWARVKKNVYDYLRQYQ